MDKLVYMKGELLQVHTNKNEIFEGRFHGLSTDKSRISLYNVREHENSDPLEGICHYYNSEVEKIIKIPDTDLLADNFNETLKISQKELEENLKVAKKYVFVNQVDNTFHKAMADLQEYGYIAVGTEGASMGRNSKLPFLTLSTPQQIYIFDIQVMQFHAFDGGLKKLLESDYPKKIIHDSRKISDCLHHKHNVTLKSVFDTQVADLIIFRNKTGEVHNKVKSLAECLNTYLGLPYSVIDEKLDTVKSRERPLAVEIKETLSKNMAFLHCLSEVINNELMLPFNRGVECFLDNLRSCDDYKAWELYGKHNQVPKEFKNAVEY